MLASQNRGKSASGMAYMNAKQEVMIRKQEGPAEDLVNGMTDAQWAEVARSPRALFHARATTKGTEKDNVNNHPVSAYGWVAVHNGHISNDDDLFDYYKDKRYAAVDTAAVPLVLKQGENYDDSLRYLSLLGGTASLALWSLDNPDTIALARLGSNDVYLFFDPFRDITYWCSTPIGGRAVPGFSLGNLAFFTVAKLHENRVLILEPTKERARLLTIERKPFLARKQHQPYQPHQPYQSHQPQGPYQPSRGYFHHGIGNGVKQAPPVQTTPVQTVFIGRTRLCNSLYGYTHGDQPREFEWGQPNEACNAKPPVDVSGVSSHWFDWDTVIAHFRAEYVRSGEAASVFTLVTAYGRWVFNCPSTSRGGIFESTFLPARRIKKFWRRNFDKEIPETKLPPKLGVLDERMTLEEFAFAEIIPTSPPGKIHHMGYMCPWCGIIMRTHQWGNLAYRCPACGVVSHPHKKEE